MPDSYSVRIPTELPPSAVPGLANFMETHYLTPNIQSMKGGGYSVNRDADHRYMTWTIDPSKPNLLALPVGFPETTVTVSISTEDVVVVFEGIDTNDSRLTEVCDHIADDIEAVVTSYLNAAKRTSLHFVFSVGQVVSEAPRGSGGAGKEVLKRIFAGNTVNLYLLIIFLSFIFVFVLGQNAIVAIIAVQGLALIFSDRLMLSAGAVRVTEEHPEVAVVRIACSPEVMRSLSQQGRNVLASVREATDRAISSGNLEDPETKLAVYRILQQAGINVSTDDITLKKTNAYAIVKDVSEKFNLPIPKIAMVNTPMDNAAATGISPRHASITITVGALEDLKDDELKSVIGHEFGHVKGRDPIILFVVTMVMYLGGLYVWYPILLDLGLFYFLIAFGIIYMVGKFLETRADTQSVAVLGGPRLLASALTRIGFAQLYYERYSPRVRFLDWLRFDPHPPIYFRIKRLVRMAHGEEDPKHALWVSVRDVIAGFFGALADVG